MSEYLHGRCLLLTRSCRADSLPPCPLLGVELPRLWLGSVAASDQRRILICLDTPRIWRPTTQRLSVAKSRK
jgi:hypothetical protein